jgi:hypothetical protein
MSNSLLVKFNGLGGSDNKELMKLTIVLIIPNNEKMNMNVLKYVSNSITIIVFFCVQEFHLLNLVIMILILVLFF